MLQKLPVNKFEWIGDTSSFNEDFLKKLFKILMKRRSWNVMNDIFLTFMFSTMENYMNFTMTCHFLPERMKLEKVEKPVANLHDKTEYVIHIKNLK